MPLTVCTWKMGLVLVLLARVETQLNCWFKKSRMVEVLNICSSMLLRRVL